MVKRKSQGKATSTLTNIKRVQRSGEDAKQLFPKECRISIYIWAIKIKYKKLFRRLLTLQTSVDAIVRLTNIKEGGDILKIVSHGKFLEREFMVREKMLQGIYPLNKGCNSKMTEVSHQKCKY